MFEEWAAKWGIPQGAMLDLRGRITGALPDAPPMFMEGPSEAATQSRIRVEASIKGMRLWRNNVGAGRVEDGSFLRWGLANDSAAVNSVIKSGDLIGIRPRIIVPEDVGKLFGQFMSREVKRLGWTFTGTPRETAQMNWVNLINSLGGDAAFVDREGLL